MVRSFKLEGEKISFPTFLPLGIVLVSVFVFGIAVNFLGLVIATILLVLIASVAEPRIPMEGIGDRRRSRSRYSS